MIAPAPRSDIGAVGRRRTLVVAFLVCLATAAAYVWWKLLGSAGDPTDPTSADLLTYYYPTLTYGFREIAHLRLPLWNPHDACGTPLLAIPQLGFFYPLYLPFLFLPTATAITLDVCLHLAIASFSMFLLCRHFGMRPGPALIAGLVYAYQGTIAIKVYFTVGLAATAWIPLLFLLADRVLGRRSARAGAGLAAVFGTNVLGGYVQFVYFTGLTLGTFVVARGVGVLRRDGAAAVARGVGLLAVAVGLGALVALVRVLPAADYMRTTWRPPGSLAFQMAGIMSLSPAVFVANLLSPAPGPDVARQSYMGAVPLVLAVVGLVLARPRSASWSLAAAGGAAAVYAFGTHAPLFPFMFRLPAGSWFRGPNRALIMFGFAVAFLAGGGLDALLERAKGGRGVPPLVIFAAAAAVLVGTATWLGVPETGRLALCCLAGGVLLLAVVLRPALRSVALVLLGLLVVADLFHGQSPRGALPAQLGGYYARFEPFFADIRARQGLARTYILGRFTPGARLYFHSDLGKAGIVHGIWNATDYEPICEARLARYLQFPAPPLPWSICYLPLDRGRERRPLLDLMGVRFFLVEDGEASTLDAGRGWTLVHRADGVSLYEDDGAMPRAFVTAEVRVVTDPEALLAQLDGADLGRVAFVEAADAERLPADAAGGDVTISGYEANRVTIDARAPRGGFLVLTDRYDANWRAFVDGTPARLYRADYLFRGVVLPPGAHRVELVYRPVSFVIGGLGSLLGVAGVVLLWRR